LRKDERLTTQAIYQFVFKYAAEEFGGASRDRFVAALEAEGIPADGLFYEPLYRSVLFQVQLRDFPVLASHNAHSLPWAKTRCPVAERGAYMESVWLPHQLLLGSEQDVDQIVEAITKIQGNIDELLRADDKLIERKQMSRVERPRYAL
jgi:dTDP-4-amino-4,6-dideoxygalactose transaminase